MRITLIHNPKAGDAEHGKKELMAALAKAGHHATYQSTKKGDYEKALKKPTDLVLVAGGDGTVTKVAWRLIDTGIPLSVLPLGTPIIWRAPSVLSFTGRNHCAPQRREKTRLRHWCDSRPVGHAIFF